MRLFGSVLFGVTMLAACKGEVLSVGNPPDAGSGDASVDTYVGYIENFHFASGSDKVTLVLDSASTGTMTFGDGPALAPPTDPNAGYPPDFVAGAITDDPSTRNEENFAYSLTSSARVGDRLTFAVVPAEVWKQWCGLQTPISDGQNGYGCLTNAGGGGDANGCHLGVDDAGTPVDCAKFDLCYGGRICQCSSASCTVDITTPRRVIHVDVRFDGNTITGTTDLGPIHLERQ